MVEMSRGRSGRTYSGLGKSGSTLPWVGSLDSDLRRGGFFVGLIDAPACLPVDATATGLDLHVHGPHRTLRCDACSYSLTHVLGLIDQRRYELGVVGDEELLLFLMELRLVDEADLAVLRPRQPQIDLTLLHVRGEGAVDLKPHLVQRLLPVEVSLVHAWRFESDGADADRLHFDESCPPVQVVHRTVSVTTDEIRRSGET